MYCRRQHLVLTAFVLNAFNSMYYVLCGINALHYFWYLQLIVARTT